MPLQADVERQRARARARQAGRSARRGARPWTAGHTEKKTDDITDHRNQNQAAETKTDRILARLHVRTTIAFPKGGKT